VVELDIKEALNIEKRLKNISAGDTISAEDEKLFQMAAQLVGTLVSIYGMWSSSKKKINRLLKMIFGSQSEKLKDLGGGTPKEATKSEDITAGKTAKDFNNNDDEKKDDGKKKEREGGRREKFCGCI